MSGLEIAGVLLGAFPLLISGIEHWHNVAKVGGYFWRIRKEYTKCRSDVHYHQILYKRNLKALLLPVVSEDDEMRSLIDHPGGDGWKDVNLQARLEVRLQESYKTYMDIVAQMQETAEALKMELCFEHRAVQDKLLGPCATNQRSSASNKSTSRALMTKAAFDYQMFRVKFSVREAIREELFAQLQKCNDRLERLLATSNQIPDVQKPPSTSLKQLGVIETALKVAHKRSVALFKALEAAWNCSCLEHHFANLRLEHRTLSEACFEVILMYIAPTSSSQPSWSWKELQCGRMTLCVSQAANSPRLARSQSAVNNLQSIPAMPGKPRKVDFAANSMSIYPTVVVERQVDPNIQLCQLLGSPKCMNCMGIIGHENEIYHLHPLTTRRERDPRSSLTLDKILSPDHTNRLSRRQRYDTALVLASSIAQLQSTPWLRTELNKKDIIFFVDADDGNVNDNEPFIQQGFSSSGEVHNDAVERNFFSLGILLLELCFGRRLEDEPLRRKLPTGDDAATTQAFDLIAALQWARGVSDEGGLDYDVAVKWCFTPGRDLSKGWRKDLIRNVINPLEECQRQFKAISGI